MKICVVGMGYVGLVTAVCFAERSHDVICVDTDQSKIDSLSRGVLPIIEPGLDDLLVRGLESGKLVFCSEMPAAASEAKVFFIAVGTPPKIDGGADLTYVFGALDAIGSVASDGALIVVKSTVPPGTGGAVRARLGETLARRGASHRVEILSNPEFLREGTAVKDCMYPDRIVVGVRTAYAEDVMRQLYDSFAPQDRILVMSPESAEIAKYAANTMLAARISMMNEIANLCDKVGADIDDVRGSIALDPRIGPYFLAAGCGYGGSCFPKDVRALVRSGERCGLDMTLASAVDKVNDRQKMRLAAMVRERFGDLSGVRCAVLGLAFKPDTDDMRSAPSIDLIRSLVHAGAIAVAYDPAAIERARDLLPIGTIFASSAEDALRGADLAVIVTEWRVFLDLDWAGVGDTMSRKIIFDGRNCLQPEELKKLGFEYYCIGRSMTPR